MGMASFDPNADLVERLRIAAERGDVVRATLATALLPEAAREIERLRRQVAPRHIDREALAEIAPEILLADGLEDAFMGVTINTHHAHVAVYDYDKCVETLMRRDGMTYEEADEFLEFNTVCAYVGPFSPLYFRNVGEGESGEPPPPAGDRAAEGDANQVGVAV